MPLRPKNKKANIIPVRATSAVPIELLRGRGFDAAMAQKNYQNLLANQIARLLIAQQQAQAQAPAVPALKLPTKNQSPKPPLLQDQIPLPLPTPAIPPTAMPPTVLPTKSQSPKPPEFNFPTKAGSPKPPAYNPPTSPQPMRTGSPRGIG